MTKLPVDLLSGRFYFTILIFQLKKDGFLAGIWRSAIFGANIPKNRIHTPTNPRSVGSYNETYLQYTMQKGC